MDTKWLENFLKNHNRIAMLDAKGNGYVEYVPRETTPEVEQSDRDDPPQDGPKLGVVLELVAN